MEWVETTGRSVQEAKEKALDELGVDEVDAEFEVVAEAQTGLFGRLRSEARVRARVRPTAPRAKEERRDRRRRSGGGGAGGSAGTGGSNEPATRIAPTAEADKADKPDKATSRSGRDRSDRADGDPSVRATPSNGTRGNGNGTRSGSASGAAGRVAERTPGTFPRPAGSEEPDDSQADSPAAGRRNPSRRRGRGPNRPVTGSPSGAQRASAESDQDDDFDTAKGPEVEVDLDRQAEVAVEFLTKLVAEFGLEATVEVARPDEDTVELQLSGSDLGILIGPKGATLLAVQNLVRTVVFNETGGSNGHINVDVGGYRQKRSEALARFATQVATTVKESGARTVLEPMSAVDRKVVHDTISAIDGVSTISEGEEPRRRVVVLPG